MGKFINLVGMKFNKLLVLRRNKTRELEYREKHGGFVVFYDCECECGEIVTARPYDLKSGKHKMCKKCSSIKQSEAYVDISNMKFGKLIAIRLDRIHTTPNGTNKRFWLCECECGNTVTVNYQSLVIGSTKSCGCTKYDKTTKHKNEYTISEDGGYYTFTIRNNNNEILYGKVDVEDYDIVKAYTWRASNAGGYPSAQEKNGKRKIKMHRLLIGDTGDFVVDHIDRNPLNNRRNNLRITTPYQNHINKSISKYNKSGITGVVWHKRDNIWESNISYNNTPIYLGRYTNKNDAIVARLEAELKYFGEDFAPQRHLFEEYSIL